MFKAIGRWFKSLGYLLTGQIDAARREVETHPNSIRARYDQIVKDKVAQIQQYKQAIASIIAQQENKLSRLKDLSEEIEKLERLKAGALAKARQTVDTFQASGKSKDEIHADDDYQKCLTAFKDFDASLKEKRSRIGDLEQDVKSYQTDISNHKIQLQQLLRDVEKIKEEAAEAVADVISSKQERDLADMLSGISDDSSTQELSRLRQMRQELKAEARVSKELAGTDTKAQEAEFLEYARKTTAHDEFDALIGLADQADTAPPSTERAGGESETPNRLPE